MNGFLASPLRNLAIIVSCLLTVTVVATLGYMAAGWSLPDAFYMVVLTIYTVGFREVRPIDSHYLRALTMGVMFFGCTGMILMTGALVQLFTATEIRNLLGANRVKTEIDKLNGHIIVCGFGRIGGMVAQDLKEGGAAFLILERDEKIAAEARRQGYLALVGDATDEATLLAAGIARARTLATVLPNDAANVFITLSARSLNPELRIIARGEAPTTERKLVHAGANQVILPTHIGAERIAELILYPATAQALRGSREGRAIERSLRDLGLEIEMVGASALNGVAGLTVGEVEQRAAGALLVTRIERADGEQLARPTSDTPIHGGDGLVVVSRSAGAFSAVFGLPAPAPGEGD